jgi:hypothetical protein
MEPTEFDEYDQEVLDEFVKGVKTVALLVVGMVLVIAGVAGKWA